MSQRKTPTDAVLTELLSKCRRRCCMCYSLDRDARQKNGQVAHIDRDSSNSAIENLAYLCLDHHNAYDSRMSQSKNYTPGELFSYKSELEHYISAEWNKPVLSNEITVDIFSGKYSHSIDNASADIEIKYVGGNILQIEGMAFYGTNREGGPNMGNLDCVAEIVGTKAIFRDKFYDDEYVFEITFLGSKISVSDNYIMGYYGNGVCFSGEYFKVTQSETVEKETQTAIEVMNVAVYGCFTVKGDRKIVTDSVSEEINSIVQVSINNTNSKIYSYKNAILLHYAQISEEFFSALDYEKLNQQIKLKVHDLGHIASIHFFNNEVEHKLHVVVNYNENVLNYSEPSESAQSLGNLILNSNSLTRSELVNICLNLFYLVYSQVHLDIMLEEKDYKNLHYTLDGCQKLAMEIKSTSVHLEADKKLQIEEFLNFWLSHCERYRAITLAIEKEYQGAVSSIIKAISYNPFYPYKNYESLKADYNKRYAVDLVPELNNYKELFPEIDVTAEENLAIAEELWQQIEFKEVSYNYMILKDIMCETQNDKALIAFIEQELTKLDDNSPFILVTKSEIVRFLKKGWRRVNKIYYSRMDETIGYLKKAAELDPDFPVLYTKIGSLLIMKGAHSFLFGAKSSWEGAQMYNKGSHFLAQLGFRMRPKS
jgi:Txe/YoeB family toxin of Txe-Axe toxin-antitoxin module